MEVLHGRCAGLDVHKDTVVACVRIQQNAAAPIHQVRTFGTTTQELLALSDFLEQHQVTVAAMEATGVYWKPVWHVLEESFELVLANAQHIKNVPGRKTDVADATWIADLLAHGLIRSSFVPPTPIQDLRVLMRTRKQLVRERAQHVQRIQKTLEDANIKLASAVSDVVGTSGRAILRALIAGETDPEKLVAVTTGRLKAGRDKLLEVLQGRVRASHRFLLKLHLEQIQALEQSISTLDVEVGSLLEPFREQVARLVTIPGVSDVAAQVLLSEIGVDMSRFPTAGHLISWAGLCPRNDESAGKRRSNGHRFAELDLAVVQLVARGYTTAAEVCRQLGWPLCATPAERRQVLRRYKRLATPLQLVYWRLRVLAARGDLVLQSRTLSDRFLADAQTAAEVDALRLHSAERAR